MDFDFSEDQKMLQAMARDFLEKKCPKTLVRGMEEDAKGYSPDLWRDMAELGWMGLALPEKYGGTGYGFIELAMLLEQMGRALVPGPFVPTVVNCALPILEAGTEEQRQEFLPKIASGKLILTLALTEPGTSPDAYGIAMEAIADKGEYIISGTKLFVPDAHVSDYLLCATRTQEMTKPDEGITLFLVDTKSPGISCTVLQTIASDKQCEVTFDKVRVPAANMLGGLDDGWRIMERIMQQAVVAQCALMIGGAQQVLEMTVRYAKERVQFDKPIGSFQAIQHKCADMVTDVDGAKLITYEAAWMLSKGMACAKEVSMAKAWVSEAYRRTCVEGLQIHGGIGFTKDCDMQLYFRRGKAQELAFGDADFHQEIVSRRIGL